MLCISAMLPPVSASDAHGTPFVRIYLTLSLSRPAPLLSTLKQAWAFPLYLPCHLDSAPSYGIMLRCSGVTNQVEGSIITVLIE